MREGRRRRSGRVGRIRSGSLDPVAVAIVILGRVGAAHAVGDSIGRQRREATTAVVVTAKEVVVTRAGVVVVEAGVIIPLDL